ncbi:MAG TPA: hypothetical protein VG871_14865 [Vicinamibacterales bacterium]|nr:hypothetical protein [Vicinamibacterales bacterium]
MFLREKHVISPSRSLLRDAIARIEQRFLATLLAMIGALAARPQVRHRRPAPSPP